MLDLRFIVNNAAKVEDTLKKRGMEKVCPVVQEIVELDKKRREMLQAVEALKHKRNEASQNIARTKKEGGDVSDILKEMKKVSEEVKTLDEKIGEVQEKIKKFQFEIPNLLDPSTPVGKDEKDNPVIRSWGEPPKFDFKPKGHFEIGEKMGILDFKKAGEVVGSRFVYLKGLGARLERALIQFMLDAQTKRGYEEIIPPYLVNRNALIGTGQLPKFEEDVFHIEKYDLFLSPTAEVQLTNYHRQEILDENSLPRKYVGYSACFRSEAGSYGKDTKGLKRQHQFNKVELVKFTKADQSSQELESLTQDAENILQQLNISYRVIALCSGDVGFSSAKTYDIEVWSPYEQAYMEISSCSNFYDFQARRANIRTKNADTGKVEYVHTLNGSGLAVGRTLIALIENYQKKDGTFDIPPALQPYLK